MILGIGFLLMVSLVFSAALAALSRWWDPLFGGWADRGGRDRTSVRASLLSTAVFAMIYKVMPRVQSPGATSGSARPSRRLLFIAGKFADRPVHRPQRHLVGLRRRGSLVVVLLWVYYSAQIFLLGAEFTWVTRTVRLAAGEADAGRAGRNRRRRLSGARRPRRHCADDPEPRRHPSAAPRSNGEVDPAPPIAP